ncbi:MAG TPA: phosphotriesterase, partial [Chloroflexi bacterium]|nr:phosphotriesterase [Chloroflexota bacterium]
FEEGIEGSGVYPGFMKIGVAPEAPLSPLHEKLVRAAARAHLQTGMPIASHTGPAAPAFGEIAVLEEEGVHPSAFIWVHAQSEQDFANYEIAARKGAWISLDGVAGNFEGHLSRLLDCREKGILDQVLLSHDAGWYRPGEPDGGKFTPFTALFDALIPRLKEAGFTEDEIHLLVVENPREAFTIRVRARAE